MNIGSAVGRTQGVTEEQIRELSQYATSPVFSEVERLVLEFSTAVTVTPVDVPDDLFQKLAAHFSHEQLVELASCIAWENYRARYDHAFRIGPDGFSDGAACALPAHPQH